MIWARIGSRRTGRQLMTHCLVSAGGAARAPIGIEYKVVSDHAEPSQNLCYVPAFKIASRKRPIRPQADLLESVI